MAEWEPAVTGQLQMSVVVAEPMVAETMVALQELRLDTAEKAAIVSRQATKSVPQAELLLV